MSTKAIEVRATIEFQTTIEVSATPCFIARDEAHAEQLASEYKRHIIDAIEGVGSQLGCNVEVRLGDVPL